MKENLSGRWLMVRMDRIGDLILSLPVDACLPKIETKWWVTKGLGFIAIAAEPSRKAKEVERKIRFREFCELWRHLKKEKYDAAVIFHGPWWVSLIIWLARVPLRAGVKSQWHSFFFLNRAVRQRRSAAEHSELEYNFRLIEEAFDLTLDSLKRGALKLKAVEPAKCAEVLARHRIRSPFVVIHPGMGGSARNWPSENYAALAREVINTHSVVITGTPSDEPFLSPVRELLSGEDRILWLDGKLSKTELITVLQSASAIVAPSTGVLHIAASTGQPTVGIFSPVRVQQAKRWGPIGARASSLTPVVECPGELRCLHEACEKFDCMPRLKVRDVLEAMALLKPR